MELKDMRSSIDKIDGEIAKLVSERMEVVAQVAKFKAEHNLPIFDPERERQKLSDIASQVGADFASKTDAIFSLIFDLSRSCQHQITSGESPVKEEIRQALLNTEKQLPSRPLVACQGVEGAYSQLACDRIFPACSIMYFNSFENVFSAVEQGLCRYGILPLENSIAGSVNRIYDLMMKHDFHIVRSTRIKVDHCLLANKGAKLENIKEIYSHEQALEQCTDFLKTLKNVKIKSFENTAAASKMVLKSGRSDVAALSSRNCATIYGLDCLLDSVQNQGSNFTRFICISKNLEIYPGANRTSLMLVTPNRCGSLYRVLSRFNALRINLLKLESRPLPNNDFEFMFYFDLDTSVYSEEFLRMFDDLEDAATSIKYLGSYTEVV
ncbi:MAG: prephenate dehydratase domain-containing protein [Bacillota bacterium]|nr:prephenate dehydratase domain-containing protein [Bacillota bacterium]